MSDLEEEAHSDALISSVENLSFHCLYKEPGEVREWKRNSRLSPQREVSEKSSLEFAQRGKLSQEADQSLSNNYT